MKSTFSKSWNRSIQPRKQRKYRYNAPLHIRQKFIRANLSKELRQKYNKRTFGIRTGDKIKVVRGEFKGKSGKVEMVDLKKSHIYLTSVDSVKKDGTKALIPINPTNVIIIELNLDDKKRKGIITKSAEKKTKEDKEDNKSQPVKNDPTDEKQGVKNGKTTS